MNYGTVKIVEGVYRPKGPDEAPRNGIARMGLGPDGALAPPIITVKQGAATLVIDLYYNDRAQVYVSGKSPAAASLSVGYSKNIKRLAKGGNPLGSATRLISDLAGCYEAKGVRGRAIALSRIRNTISGETFRFRLGGA